MKKIIIGFVSSKNSQDISSLSGGLYYMSKALIKHCGEVVPFYLDINFPLLIGKMYNKITRFFMGKQYMYQHSLLYTYICGKVLTRKLKKNKIDIIFASRSASQIAFLKTDVPIIYTSDATFKLMEDYY